LILSDLCDYLDARLDSLELPLDKDLVWIVI